MAADIELARGHFECALRLLQLRTSSPGVAALLDGARTAHGAGLRRLRRVPPAPWLSQSLAELSRLEKHVRHELESGPAQA